MNISLSLSVQPFTALYKKSKDISIQKVVLFSSLLLAIAATAYSFFNGIILAYGDAESHINIAKRVVSSLTPGFAQLGGVWLPLPHLLMTPFTEIDVLWRTGLAGSIVSGASFVVTCIYLYKLVYLVTKNRAAGFVAFLVFGINPNILYMQSTPMTELPLIVFFVLSTYYFVKYIKSRDSVLDLVLASLFAFCAAFTRYDGWFVVLAEAGLLAVYYLPQRDKWKKMEGRIILFSTFAFFAILLWLLWDYLILGDPLYFTNSVYSAKSQQANWLHKGELPAYHNVFSSFIYYFVTSMDISGILLFLTALCGLFIFLRHNSTAKKHAGTLYAIVLLLVPFLFYWATLFDGQSVIFIPSLTPSTFEWRLFNVRYGLMMVPFVAFMFGYLFSKAMGIARLLLISIIVSQVFLYVVGYSQVLTLADGTTGLSASKNPDAQVWLSKHYDKGYVLLDDYARTISIIKSNIPMQDVINVGNKPYYQDSFTSPEKYATWIVLQKDDDIWKHLYDNTVERGRLYKYFQKVYTSDKILIFKRNQSVTS